MSDATQTDTNKTKKKRGLLIDLAVVAVAIAVGLGFWNFSLRYRPKTPAKHETEIVNLLQTSGWVSPGLSKDKAIWLIGFRACPDCIRFETEQFPDLQKAGVDTRVILFPRREQSDAAERSGVAELWAKRDWKTLELWMSRPPQDWKATDIPVADEWYGRTLLVEQSRQLVEKMRPLLADNGIKMAYPTLIWRDAQGRLRGCACEKAETYKYVRKELGVTG